MDHPNALASYIYWADLVTERTEGAVTFEWYPLGQLLKPTEALAGVGAGVADLSILVPIWDEWVSICEKVGKGDDARQLLEIVRDVSGREFLIFPSAI